MKADRVQRKFESTLATWRARLGPRPEADFGRRPAGGGWCLGQVCDHLKSASDLLLGEAEKCARGEGERKGAQVMPAMITLFGSLPPGRFKVPDKPELRKLAEPRELTKDAALECLGAMGKRVTELRDPGAAAPRNLRRRHPAAGWMNAVQFYQVAEMHLRHHLRQLARIERALQ